MDKKWYSLDVEIVRSELATDIENGLSIREARRRLEKEKRRDGGERSSLFIPQRASALKIIFSFFSNPTFLLLLITSFLAALFGELFTGAVVLGLSCIFALICAVVSVRAQRRLESMRDYASPMVKVRRAGEKYFTDGRNAVEGDIILLSGGDLVPCDVRIISSDEITVKELIYTRKGIRNRVVSKNRVKAYEENESVEIVDAENMILAGSAIIQGNCEAIVVATGSETYLSKSVGSGALSSSDDDFEGIKSLKPTVHKVCFLCFASLAVLSLISVITLKETTLVDNFMMLLASVAMISLEFIRVGARNLLIFPIERMSRIRRKKKDASAAVRDIRAIDTLTGITDIVLLGRVALFDGIYHVSDVYTSGGVIEELSTKSDLENRILTCVYTYVRALRESGYQNEFILNGIPDALTDHLKNVGFDEGGASLVTKSLYFVNDPKGENGFACAETTMSVYRVALTFDDSILSFCELIRANDGSGVLPIHNFTSSLLSFKKDVEASAGRCLYVVSECDGKGVLEGIIKLSENPPLELVHAKEQLDSLGIRTTVMIPDENEEGLRLITLPELARLFDGKIAYASTFKELGLDVTHSLGDYCTYIGFSSDQYCELIKAMRNRGSCVAAYGLDNSYYDLMTSSDLAISCDILQYSSDKYKESVYERLVPEGRDSNIRCSQQMRFASKLIVRRTHANGGGLNSVVRSIVSARAAYVSFSQSLLLFAMLLSTLLPIVVMSVLTGSYLLSAVQAASLSLVGALLSVFAFSDTLPKSEIIGSKIRFSSYPLDLLKSKLPSMIARALAMVLFGVAIKILDVSGVFGEDTAYEMAVYIALLLTVFSELFIILLNYSRKGEGRRRSWFKVILAYTVLLGVGALITQDVFVSRTLVNGIGDSEFIVIPLYALIYFVGVLIGRYIEQKRKNL